LLGIGPRKEEDERGRVRQMRSYSCVKGFDRGCAVEKERMLDFVLGCGDAGSARLYHCF
jgi:hypothetical protein